MDGGGGTARSDLIGGAGWMVFGLAVVAGAWRMDRFQAMGATLYTMPGLVPGVFGAVIVLLGGVLALRGWRRLLHEGAGARTPLLNRRVAFALALCLAYAAVAVGRVPFAPATALFVAAFTWAYTPADRPPLRRLAVAVASGVLTALAIVLVFERVFLVRLP